MTTEDVIALCILLLLGIILVPCIQGMCCKYHNPYGKCRVYKNMNEKYFVKYVKFYAYGIIPVWHTYKTSEDTCSPWLVREFTTKKEACEVMGGYYKAYTRMKNSTKISK